MKVKPPFPSVLDASLISTFRACPQKAFLEYVQHWKPRSPSVHLHAGAAYASALEATRRAFYLEGKSSSEAAEIGMATLLREYGDFPCPEDSAKSASRMAGALEFYLHSYPLESDAAVPVTLPDGSKGIEVGFAEPLPINHPETGDPLIYAGRLDMMVNYAGAIYGLDDKTSSSLGASWSKQWEMRSQFTGYCWGAARLGFPLSGFLVRGVSILKTKYDTQQALTYRPQWMIDRWYEQLLRDIHDMLECWESGIWDWNLDASCEAYGGCPFKKVCLAAEPDAWLSTGFERRSWDPITRKESLLES
ncbi:MAG TPA: PD-(D/E)XK nuclease family protein [Nitrospira sp.]|nr:PD-(D/E)XK nuclease family protein [Nitrospira sp.]